MTWREISGRPSSAAARNAESRFGAAHAAALSALVPVPPADVELIFMGIQAHEQERKTRRAQREREAAAAGRRNGGLGLGNRNSGGGGATSPREAMAEFEQFLSGVVRLAARMQVPPPPDPGSGGGGGSGSGSEDSPDEVGRCRLNPC